MPGEGNLVSGIIVEDVLADNDSTSSGSCSIEYNDVDDDATAPPGSLLYKCHQAPPSPTNIMDFPNDTESDDESVDDPPTMEDYFSLSGLSLNVVRARVRLCAISKSQWRESPFKWDKGGLCDPGANIGMTNDPTILRNIRQLLVPLTVGVAMDPKGGDKVVTSVCTHVGDLPLPTMSGEIYYQKCYLSPDATDTFISPSAICDDSGGLLKGWSQSANKAEGRGFLCIYSDSGLYQIKITLNRFNGLYYCSSDT